jgi:hypothetical protein
MILQKQTKTKTRKRKRSTVQYESDVFTNCVKTYQKTLNCQILEQKLFFNDGIQNLPTDCTVTKKQLKEIKRQRSQNQNLRWYYFFWSWRGISKLTCNYQHLGKCSHISYIAPILPNVLGYCK